MENNHLSNHICNNNHKRMERNYGGRIEMGNTPRREENLNCEGDNLHHHVEHNDHLYCDRCDHKCQNEHGGEVYTLNVEKSANKNYNFRESVWTGKYLQMTLMSIASSNDIGVEMHKDTDQYIRIEHGYALVLTGRDQDHLNDRQKLCKGDAVFIPAGIWHNIVNIGRCTLKVSSVYAPPHHPRCTVQPNK